MTGPRIFYNTNGFAFHRLEDAAAILAELGYDGVAWTPDVHHLDPLRATPAEVRAFGALLARLGLALTVETGARFVLDRARKHRPSLLDAEEEAGVRLAYLKRCVDLAAELGAPVVSTWSGSGPPSLSQEAGMERLARGLRVLCEHGAARGVRIAFEPEPGMLIERTDQWPEVKARVDHAALGLTLDVGHCLATEECAPEGAIRLHAPDLLLIHLDDHRRGTHEHLAFGEGEVDFDAVARAVQEAEFRGPLEVELSRHAATGPTTARESLSFLRRRFPSGP